MKNKVIRIRADQEFIDKVNYLQQINGYKSGSDTVRRTVEKEFRKETTPMKEEYEWEQGLKTL